ncbi:hypothetical protein [Chryseobacterium gallinarum]|uniref:hypothetical protein n=1 Tax=Chryseobacterium gallinarum TaxID=1324352 RepID=UPI000AF2A9CA|nr:hypothetical protein [Chryseobacterium gallinarum]
MKNILFILLGTVMIFSQNNRFIYEVKYKKRFNLERYYQGKLLSGYHKRGYSLL